MANILDFSDLSIGHNEKDISYQSTEIAALASKLVLRLKEDGFAILQNCGIPASTVKERWDEMETFFTLPREKKMKYAREAGTFAGWMEQNIMRSNRDLSSAFLMPHPPKFMEEQLWPEEELPGIKEHTMTFMTKVCSLMDRILKCIALGLNLQDIEAFSRHNGFGACSQMIRYNYYPPRTEFDDVSDDALRMTAHRDWCHLTLLFQDGEEGLEIQKSSGEWVSANQSPGNVLLQVGTGMERSTGGVLKAPMHRVARPKDDEACKRTRRCLAYFWSPDYDTMIEPLIGDKEKYTRLSTEDHLMSDWNEQYE